MSEITSKIIHAKGELVYLFEDVSNSKGIKNASALLDESFSSSVSNADRVLELDKLGLSTRYAVKFDKPIAFGIFSLTHAYFPKLLSVPQLHETLDCQMKVYQPGRFIPVIIDYE